jgi:hypothetical protein
MQSVEDPLSVSDRRRPAEGAQAEGMKQFDISAPQAEQKTGWYPVNERCSRKRRHSHVYECHDVGNS